jgi:hypothetical protein
LRNEGLFKAHGIVTTNPGTQDKKRYLAFKLKRAACQLTVLFQDYRFPDWQGSNVSDVVTASFETTVYSVRIFLTSEASSSGIDKDGAAH